MDTLNAGRPDGGQDHDHQHGHAHPAEVEHLKLGHGALRAAVFGMSDGLVSTAALVVGVAGGGGGREAVLLAGIAGLLAGASSMGVGEWVSVRSQAEALLRQLRTERDHLHAFPNSEREHMRRLLVEAGLSAPTAAVVVSELHDNPKANLNFHARLELGIDPDELGSPGLAALSSFLAFGIGGLFAVVPWLFDGAGQPLMLTLLLSAGGLLLLGAAISRLTDRPLWWSALRQLLLGAGAAGLTWAVGSWVGTAV
jgi:vacuolar iron transporter family protein